MRSLCKVITRKNKLVSVGRSLCRWRDPAKPGQRASEGRQRFDLPGDTRTIRRVADATGTAHASILDDLTAREGPDTTSLMRTMPPTATVSLLDKPAGGSLVLDRALPSAALTGWGLPMGRGTTVSSLTFDHSRRKWSPLHLALTLPPYAWADECMEAGRARVGRRDRDLSGQGSVRLSRGPVPWAVARPRAAWAAY